MSYLRTCLASLAQSSRFTRVIDGQVTDPKRWFERYCYPSGVELARCVVGKVLFVHRVSEMHTLVSAGFPRPPAVDKEKIHPRAELAVVITPLNTCLDANRDVLWAICWRC